MELRVINRLVEAMNKHDIDALVACFAPDYVNVWPVHPGRSFTGRDQVRRNWEMMFKARPDLKVTVSAHAHVGDEDWAEWKFVGTERDGALFHQRGVNHLSRRGRRDHTDTLLHGAGRCANATMSGHDFAYYLNVFSPRHNI